MTEACTQALIKATYLATRPDAEPEALAEAIAREQSLEILDELIPDAIRRTHLAQVERVVQVDDQRWALHIAYPAHLASAQLGQLMQLLYGNVSFYPRIRLVDLALPKALLEGFEGPRLGITGIRNRIDVHDRALLLTVLKPRGADPEHLASIAHQFAMGGGDILKDDQNLVETTLEGFSRRVSACADAVERARHQTGRECLYLPHVAGSGDHLQAQLDWVADRGLPGVVICPWIMGLEAAAAAVSSRNLMWLAHPAGAGVYTESQQRGITPEIIFGQLPRLAGADLCIYPGVGGRISVAGANSEPAIIEALTKPWTSLRRTLPCTGGGKTLDQAGSLARRLGRDCAIVVGGDLLRRGSDLRQATERAVADLACVNPT